MQEEAIDIDYELFIIWRETTIDITPMSTNSQQQMSPSQHHFSAINTKANLELLFRIVVHWQVDPLAFDF